MAAHAVGTAAGHLAHPLDGRVVVGDLAVHPLVDLVAGHPEDQGEEALVPPERLLGELGARYLVAQRQYDLLMDAVAVRVPAAVRNHNDDRGLQVEGTPALAVRIDARLHPIQVEQVEGVAQRLAHGGEAVALQVLQLVHERGMVLLPAGLHVGRRLLEGEQHVAIAEAVLRPLAVLEERLHGALGNVQIRLLHPIHIRLLAHGRRSVHQEEYDCHGGFDYPIDPLPLSLQLLRVT